MNKVTKTKKNEQVLIEKLNAGSICDVETKVGTKAGVKNGSNTL